MRVCFWHEDFDTDVSSGTEHAVHQWHETITAFNVKHVAVINEAEHVFAPPSDSYKFESFSSFPDFLKSYGTDELFFVEKGDFTNHRQVWIPATSWVIIGGAYGLPMDRPDTTYVTIPTRASLYPMHAAAIVLENQKQLRQN